MLWKLLQTHLPAFDEMVWEPAGPDQMMWVIGAQQQFVRVAEICKIRDNESNCKVMQTDDVSVGAGVIKAPSGPCALLP